jgi:hypothetical protein
MTREAGAPTPIQPGQKIHPINKDSPKPTFCFKKSDTFLPFLVLSLGLSWVFL